MSLTLKPALVQLHRWVALVLSPLFIVLILTGLVLSFRPIANDMSARAVIAHPVDFDALLSVVKVLENQGALNSIAVTDNGTSVEVNSTNPDTSGPWNILSGQRIESVAAGSKLFETTEQLHKTLLLGLGVVVEAATWAMLVIMLFGPLLAWLRFRNTLMGWHKALGWCAFPITVLSPLTAVLMTLGIGTRGSTPLPTTSRPVAISQALAAAASEINLSHLISARRFRGGMVMLQVAEEGLFAVTDKGVTPLKGGPGLAKQIHEGTWAGMWSGTLNVFVSFVLLALMLTGLLSWFRRRRQKHVTIRTEAAAF